MIHGFVRGIGGAVVSFPEDEPGARLWLTAGGTTRAAARGVDDRHAHLPVTTCTVCGQHYYVVVPQGLLLHRSAARRRRGRRRTEAHWEPLDETNGGNRLVLVDRLIGESDSGGDSEGFRTHRTAPLLPPLRRRAP